MSPVTSPTSAGRLAWKRRTYALASINLACFLALAITLPTWRRALSRAPVSATPLLSRCASNLYSHLGVEAPGTGSSCLETITERSHF